MAKVVTFNIDMDSEKGGRLKDALNAAGFDYYRVLEDNLCDQVGYIAGLPGYEASGEKPTKSYKSEFMLICGADNKELNLLLAAMKEQKVSIGNKAIVTEHNISWRLCDLIDEVIKERQIMMKMGR